jgi:chorismate synthase
MSGMWGNKIKLSIFGESHGKAVGITINGIEPGVELDMENINREMNRRAPGKNEISTSRNEKDSFEILSGYFNGKTTGSPLCAVIHNMDQHSNDYEKTKDLIRPSHGDYTGYIKYNGFNDYRGGGHFSGRITAPLVFAGAICKQILEGKGIIVGSHIKSIGEIVDNSFNMLSINKEDLKKLTKMDFPLLDTSLESNMKEAILKAKIEKDSIGGVVEATVINLPPGLGSPFFDSVESNLAHLLFSIPGIKGVEFGEGFGITKLKGSAANDEYYIEEDKIRTYSNNNGGVLGGITNGMPLIFRAAVKPTASIGKVQNTVDIEKRENSKIEIKGRHDPCIVPRVLPVIEAVAAIAILDLL